MRHIDHETGIVLQINFQGRLHSESYKTYKIINIAEKQSTNLNKYEQHLHMLKCSVLVSTRLLIQKN